MKIYTLLMESFHYDGDGFVIVDVNTEMRNCKDFATAKWFLDTTIDEKLDGFYNEDQLIMDGDDYAVFVDYPNLDGNERILYRLTIYERELEEQFN